MEYAQLHPTDTNIHSTPEEVKRDARAAFDKTMATVTEKSREAARYADRRVQEHPWTAVGIGFGAGVMFGALVALVARAR
jgi:ElaB/YqjD/DUF883 family membrane-anchored ribosome-binding protein